MVTIKLGSKPVQATITPFIAFLFFLITSVPFSQAAIVAEKTPADVLVQVQKLAEDVKELRKRKNVTAPWPKVYREKGREPRHVLQKALEVMGKINRFRINILKTGAISVPRFPGRDITPNEVYNTVVRLRDEINLLIKGKSKDRDRDSDKKNGLITALITSSHVYAALSEVSEALDETLGLRGFTPSDVYEQSLRVLELAKFLRKSQNLPMNVTQPARTNGKLSNHALASVYQLFERIHQAEKNLWMKPIRVPEVPRRVISPVDVYDAISVSLSELQRIKFRLGLERDFKDPSFQAGKTPDDVIRNTEWAMKLLPDFKLERPLRQFDKITLKKTPNHVFSVTEHILERLREYRRRRGIQASPRKAEIIHGLQPQHVYEKALEILEKVDVVRRSNNLGAIAVQRFPLRLITPSEVFDLALRLDEELDILFRHEGMASNLWLTASIIGEYEDKTPSDVFLNMQRISLLLDTILGSDGFTPSHVFREAISIRDNIRIIGNALGEPFLSREREELKNNPGIEPRDVFFAAKDVMTLTLKAKRRAGMFDVRDISIPPGETVTPTDVYNQVRIIDAELTELKVFLGISGTPERPGLIGGKKPSHVFQVLEEAKKGLSSILHIKGDISTTVEEPQ